MGMHIEAMKSELKAMDERMNITKKADGNLMEKLLSLKVEKVEKLAQEPKAAPRWTTLAVKICGPVMRFGAEILFLFAVFIVGTIGLLATLTFAQFFAAFALEVSGQSIETTFGGITVIAVYCTAICAYFQAARGAYKRLREWADSLKLFYSQGV